MPSVKFFIKILQHTFFSILFLLIFVSNAVPQSRNEFADSLSAVLQKKLLLDNSQKLEVKNILIDYINKPESESSTLTAHDEISKVLDKRQKAKFDIIKNEFWQTINKKRKELNQKK